MSKTIETVNIGIKLDGRNFPVWSRLMKAAIGSREKLEQSRYQVEMIYIQDRDIVENQTDSGLAMNCPNCGAPLPKLGAKECLYCDTPIMEFNIRIWNFSDVEEG